MSDGFGPLQGIRVVELTTAFAGPYAGRCLAYLGADVIHVESASRPDLWRHHNQVFNDRRYPGGKDSPRRYNRISLFNTENINKRSLTLELKNPRGRAAFLKLIAHADVFLSNFTPGTLDRLGIGYAQVKEARPDIVMVEMPAFGSYGPMAMAGALAPTMEMVAGMSSMVAYQEDGRPYTTGPAYLDAVGGLNGAAAVMTALMHRQATGEGQYVEMPQCEAAMQFIGEYILDGIENGNLSPAGGNRIPTAAPHDAFPASGDDQWVAIAAFDDEEYTRLMETIGRADLARAPEFATLAGRRAGEDKLWEAIAARTRQLPKHEIASLLQRAGVHAAAVQDARDVVESAYLREREFFTVLDHPEAGRHPYPGMPFHLSATPGEQRSAAPCFGADTDVVLREVAGLTEDEILALNEEGVTSSVPIV